MEHAGLNQTELAARVKDISGASTVSPQTIQYLVDPANKAAGSKYTSAIAQACGVNGVWLASGFGDMITGQPKKPVHTHLRVAWNGDHVKDSGDPRQSYLWPETIPSETWRALEPETRALVEKIVLKSASGALTHDDVILIMSIVERLKKQ